MPRILTDPMAAGFVWRILLLIFAWVMYRQLTQGADAYVWWGNILKGARLLPKEEEEYQDSVDGSARLFKWLGIAAAVLTVVHTVQYYRVFNPSFLGGPRPVAVDSSTGGGGNLPGRMMGAGGGGVVGRPGAAPLPGAAPGVGTGTAAPTGTPGSGTGAPMSPGYSPVGAGTVPSSGGGGVVPGR